MSGVAIAARGLGKSYWIPRAGAPGWRDVLTHPRQALAAPRRTEVRALDDVSFDVEQGEVLGIIGRNGAGKSTLLKILSRITTPSRGRAMIRGRVASLLEVGTGFHPDLTGRENVYLNGMLLGMPRQEVDRSFDAIADFAAIGKYMTVPIKRYSSGMQLRLAFAVAAHLAADTMIIDEVLAVGDAEFQRKCLGAMRNASRTGRTTLFVSHLMSAVESLCTKVMWLDGGVVRAIGRPEEVIRAYLAGGLEGASDLQERIELDGLPRGRASGLGRLRSITFCRRLEAGGRPPWQVAYGEPFDLEVGFDLERPIADLLVGVVVRNDRGEDVLTTHSCDGDGAELPAAATGGVGRVRVTEPWLRPGTYFVETVLQSARQPLDAVRDSALLVVEEVSSPGAPRRELKRGAVAPIWTWEMNATNGN
jgi:lipopolysaccharide transport system ATP-binding protein